MSEPAVSSSPSRRLPLYVQILLAVVLGVLAAQLFGPRCEPLGALGLLVVRALKALATPVMLFAVMDAFLRTEIPARKGLRLVFLSLTNAAVAVLIGLGVANLLHRGTRWQGQLGTLAHQLGPSPSSTSAHSPPEASLNLIKNFGQLVPESLLDPFLKNNVITVVLFALILGLGLRRLRSKASGELAQGIQQTEALLRVATALFASLLEALIHAVPFAVFGIVASVVAKTGTSVFRVLGDFLFTVVLGLALHAVVYYSLLLRTLGRTSPRRFFAGAADAIITALSCGSSLATLPVTLRCLREKLGVTEDSARLAACVGTNLNHDGIILYEAAAAIFTAQAFGHTLGLGQQLSIALASVLAGIGIAGVPEAGLITLPLVLGSAGLPDSLVATMIPLLLPVDWIIGRCRAATNVTSDMTVAVLLDKLEDPTARLQK